VQGNVDVTAEPFLLSDGYLDEGVDGFPRGDAGAGGGALERRRRGKAAHLLGHLRVRQPGVLAAGAQEDGEGGAGGNGSVNGLFGASPRADVHRQPPELR
jgi:hypothetical protein